MKIVQDVCDVIWLRAILLRCEYPLTLGLALATNKAEATMSNERYPRFSRPSRIPTRLPRLPTSLVGKWRKRVYMYLRSLRVRKDFILTCRFCINVSFMYPLFWCCTLCLPYSKTYVVPLDYCHWAWGLCRVQSFYHCWRDVNCTWHSWTARELWRTLRSCIAPRLPTYCQ